jgi:hypothetical protein
MKYTVLSVLLFAPQLVSAHGEHAPVDTELSHGLAHAVSSEWGIVALCALLVLLGTVGIGLRRSRTTEKE